MVIRYYGIGGFFFFSSRRRHTRSLCDWSSDVCSSDLGKNARGAQHDPRLVITPKDKKYLFIYPFVKTRAWYALSIQERKRMMDEHIRLGLTFPSVFLNTTYSYGLDDQEFVVAFETDEVSGFLDL